jgi:hypothetical protein
MTIGDVKEMGSFFKQLIDDSSLKKWVVVAGVGAIVEMIHVLWLAGTWLLGRLPR